MNAMVYASEDDVTTDISFNIQIFSRKPDQFFLVHFFNKEMT